MNVVLNDCGLKWMMSQMNVVSNECGLKWTGLKCRGLKWIGLKRSGVNCLHTGTLFIASSWHL